MDTYGIMGNPIQHSLSPLIHNLFAKQTQQEMSYKPILVEPNGLALALKTFQSQQGKGLNITSPFKQQAFNLVDQASDRAQRAKAINTIQFLENGQSLGDNTDGLGFLRDITINKRFSLQNKQILILGAGGAARAILKPLFTEKPKQITIANRTENKAHWLAEEFSDLGNIRPSSLPQLKGSLFDLIINATSASLLNENIELPDNLLNPQAFCYDMTYSKTLTPFLLWAKSQGAAQYEDGLGMLIEQAAESFYIWRNIKPDTSLILKQLKSRVFD